MHASKLLQNVSVYLPREFRKEALPRTITAGKDMAQEKVGRRVVRMSAIGNVVKSIHSPLNLNAGAYARRTDVLEDANESGVSFSLTLPFPRYSPYYLLLPIWKLS